jgi:hypothetical protein
MPANPPWFNTNLGTKVAECRSELFERRIFKVNKLFFLRN